MPKKNNAAKEAKSFRGRHFLVTLNQIELLLQLLDNLRTYCPDYLLASEEVAPSTGHRHNHIYVHYDGTKRIKIKDFLGAHVDVAKGSPQKMIAYVKKDGKIIVEEGKAPHKGGYSIKEVMDMKREERLDLPFLYLDKVLKLNSLEDSLIRLDNWHKQIKVDYIYGDSGVGKSKLAYQRALAAGYSAINVVKFVSPFYLGVTDGCLCCIYDDWRDSHMPVSEFINFIDYNRHTLNVKNGAIINNYIYIIITTVQHPKEIYPNVAAEPRRQWFRRMEFTHVQKLNGAIDRVENISFDDLDI